MRASLQDRSLIVGVDRLDYSKGLEERFLGYERFLKEHPGYHRNVVLVQIAPPSRVDVEHYRAIRAKLDSLAGRLPGDYRVADWIPIRHANQGFPRKPRSGILRGACTGSVTTPGGVMD